MLVCRCVGSAPLREATSSSGEEEHSVSVAVRLWAAGIVNPVQDDEGHAAGHDQEPEQQEGSSLEEDNVLHELPQEAQEDFQPSLSI